MATPKKSFNHGGHDKDKRTELNRVKQFLFKHTATMKQVFAATGIIRENVCRRIADLRKTNQVCKVKIAKCPITGHGRVGFYTTNPELFTESPQLGLFNEGSEDAN
jgi:hypothetical protein